MKTSPTGYWTFFNNPQKWEIDKELTAKGEIFSYRVTHKLERFNRGDMGVIRVGPDKRSKKVRGKREKLEAGIYAVVQILEPNPDGGIQLKIIQNCLNNPVLLDTLKADHRFKDKYILNGYQGSSMPLQEKAYEIIIKELAQRSKKPLPKSTKNNKFPIISHSWKILSNSIAIKYLDKSAFLHHGTGIPSEIRPFFGLEGFLEGENRPITLLYKGKSFSAHFYVDPIKRLRLFWKLDFSDVLKKELPEWFEKFSDEEKVDGEAPVMRLQALSSGKGKYEVALIFPDFIKQDIESEKAEDFEPKTEGGIKNYYGKRYERNPENRRKAIEIHGTVCAVCGFDFEKAYGERGKGFIEVHHTEPLGSLTEEKIIDPQTDLIPVCSNCHRMIHRRKNHVLSVDEVKKLLRN